MAEPVRERYGALLALSALVSAMALLAITTSSAHFFNPTDYAAWKGDWAALKACTPTGGTLRCGGLSKFPPAYLFNASWSGTSERALIFINLAVLLAPIACVALMRGWRTSLLAGSVYLLAVACSPLPSFYLNSGALEVQSGIFAGIYIASVSQLLFRKRPSKSLYGLVAFSGLVFPLYKDTAAALMGVSVAAALLIAALLAHRRRDPVLVASRRDIVLFAIAPVVTALLLVAAYNAVRYGTPLPQAYLDEARQTGITFAKSAEFLFGSIFSPNGGVLVFWFLPLFVAATGWFLLGLMPRRSSIGIAAFAAGLSCLMFARWWAPFGWDAWGDRLMVPSMLAILVAAQLSLEPRPRAAIGPRIALLTALLAAPLLVWSAYYVVVPHLTGPLKAIGRTLWPGPACEDMRKKLGGEAQALGLAFWKSDIYYRCARERMLHVPSVNQ